MNITRWEPFREMEDMLRQYSPFTRALRRADESMDGWTPLADISESEKEYLIKAQVPDVRKEDIKVTVADGVITISGERKQEKEHKDENEIRVESFYGTFTRSFTLPENADVKGVRAETKDGVLKVHVPKSPVQATKPLTIEVK